jgi:hypothetical protein
LAGELRRLAVSALARMYLPHRRLFGFCIRRGPAGDVLEGISHRYTAIVALGLRHESPETIRTMLGEHTVDDLCAALLDAVDRATDIGEVGLTLWAARLYGHPRADLALQRLRDLDPLTGTHPTVELSWCLTALSVGSEAPGDSDLRRRLALRLHQTFNAETGIFRHWGAGSTGSWLRQHVTCYADFVYPIQALSHFYSATEDAASIDMATRCAQQMCELQGHAGQWWWHFDVRTGRVLERYPVYAIHQDAMGPMALFDLAEACGENHGSAIDRCMAWLANSPELGGSLIDRGENLVWRKVARREPRKLSRSLQAVASRVHPSLRMPAINQVFAPGRIDQETRPYHMGWLLYAWPPHRVG